jgi:hypothetical protein
MPENRYKKTLLKYFGLFYKLLYICDVFMSMNARHPLNHFEEMRITYLGAVPHTIFTSLIWLISGALGIVYSKSIAILFFLIAGTFIFPGGELIRKLFKTPNAISKNNKLPLFFTLLAMTVPMSYPLLYFICKSNINLFFPAFTVLIGAHYLPFVYGYHMHSFGVLSILLVGVGTWSGIELMEYFSLQAFLTGGILLVFAILHFIKIKREFL